MNLLTIILFTIFAIVAVMLTVATILFCIALFTAVVKTPVTGHSDPDEGEYSEVHGEVRYE